MTAGKGQTIRAAAELSAGDEIEAWHKGRLFHRGQVLRVLASVGLFWIQDGRTGTRRLLDVEALDVVKTGPGGGTSGGQGKQGLNKPGAGKPGAKKPEADPADSPGGDAPGPAADVLWFSSSS